MKKGGVFIGKLPIDYKGTPKEADDIRFKEGFDKDDNEYYDELLDKIDIIDKNNYITFARNKATGLLSVNSFEKILKNPKKLQNGKNKFLDPINREPFPEDFIQEVEEHIDLYKYPNKHNDKITGFLITPSEDKIITTSLDKTVGIWNIETNKFIKKLKGHNAPIYKSALTTDGNILVVGTETGQVKVWDLEDYSVKFVFNPYPGCQITNLSFSPNKQRMLVGYGSPAMAGNGLTRDEIFIFNTNDWTYQSFKMQNTLAVLYDDAFVCMQSHNKTIIHNFDIHKEFEIVTTSITGSIKACARNDKKNQLILCYGGTQIGDLIQFNTGKRIRNIGKNSNSVNVCVISNDAQTIIVPGFIGANYGYIDIWKITIPKKPYASYKLHDEPLSKYIYTYTITISNDDSLVACALNNKEIRIMQLRDGKIIQIIPCEQLIVKMCFSKNNKYLFINNTNTIQKYVLNH